MPSASPDQGCPGRRAPRAERGYALMVILLFAALLIIGLYRILPEVAFEGQRQKEEELIFRGMQYQRAIQLFYRKNGRYPMSLDELVQTNDLRFLRKLYTDPMTKDGDWRLIHIGPGGVFVDALNPPVLQATNLGGAPNPPGGASGSSGSPGSPTTITTESSQASSPTQGSNNFGTPDAGSQQSTGFGLSSTSGSGSSQQSGSGSSGTNAASQQIGATSNPAGGCSTNQQSSTNGSGGTSGSSQQSGTSGSGGTNGSSQQSGTSSSGGTNGSSQQSQPTGAYSNLPIAGVASKSDLQSIRVWNSCTHYNEWEFIYNYQADPTAVAAAKAAGSASSVQPNTQAPGGQASVTTAPTVSTPSSSTGTSSFPGTSTTPSTGDQQVLP